jgi:NAD(P)-dependent dehydrogenase (short-subunit alcohol dehydrogenase family)
MSPRAVLVTGGTAGIGLEIARSAVARGDRVVIAGRDGARGARAVASMPAGSTVAAVQGDVRGAAGAQALVDAALEQLGGAIDVLVNSAGVIATAETPDVEPAVWDDIIATNLTGCAAVCRAAWPHVTAKPGGRIINVASVAGLIGSPGRGAYAAAKGGVIALTRVLAAEIGPLGGTANVVAPGPISGGMASHPDGYEPPDESTLAAQIPALRFGTPSEVVAAVDFLGAAEASYVNGHTLVVDGGWTATRAVGTTMSKGRT